MTHDIQHEDSVELDINTLLPEGWLRDYVAYASEGDPSAPITHHIGVGLALIAKACPREHVCGGLTPNLYVLLTGDAARLQRTRALDVARDVQVITSLPATRETLISRLAHEETLLCSVSGQSVWFAEQTEGFRVAIVDLWDCVSTTYLTPYGRLRADHPRLSLVGTALMGALRQTPAEWWEGGRMDRWVLFPAVDGRLDPVVKVPAPIMQDGQVQTTADLLRARLGLSAPAHAGSLDLDAAKILRHWVENDCPKARDSEHALKIATTLSWTSIPAAQEGCPWEIDEPTMRQAIAIVDLHRQTRRELLPAPSA